MGIYLDRIRNLTIDAYQFNSSSISNNTIDQAIDSSKDFTNGWIGTIVLIPIWFGLFQHLSNRENNFELSPLQALISVNALLFTIALVLVYVGIFSSPQHFIIITTCIFLVNIIGILRTA